MLLIDTIHHVSLPVTDLERSKQFYSDTLQLPEIPRPPFDFPGAWYQLGDRQLHLIVYDESTLREGKRVQSRDIHFAVRVISYREALLYLLEQGFTKDTDDPFRQMRVSPKATAGFPQIYIIDPDRNIIELNADRLDMEDAELEALGLA